MSYDNGGFVLAIGYPTRFSRLLRTVTDTVRGYWCNADGSLQAQVTFGPASPCDTTNADYGYSCLPPSVVAEPYAYLWDAVGNPAGYGDTVDTGDRLRAAGGYHLTYDADGGLTRKYLTADSATFNQHLFWNALSQLDSVMTTRSGTTTTVTFGYDGFGRRVRKTVRSGTTTGFLYLGADLYMQLNSSGAWTTEYSDLPGIDQPQAITTSAGATYYVARDDRSGSVAGLVRPSDDSTVAKYTYTPFGSLIAGQSVDTVPNELKFAAREYDAETGLYYFRNRYYDPQVGRFVSEDPAGLGGGINAYAFAGNDPINGRDPQGLKAIPELPLVVTTASRDCDWIDPYECGDVSGWTQWWNGLGSAGPTGSLPLPSGPGGGSSALPQTENDCSGARTHAAIEGGIDLALGVGRVAVGLFFAPETGFLSFYEAWGGAMQALSGVVDLYGAASGHVAGAEKVADVTSSFGTVSGLATLIGTGNVQYGATASSLEGLALAAGLGGWAATRPAVPIAAGEALGARGVGWADHVYGAAGLAGVSACH